MLGRIKAKNANFSGILEVKVVNLIIAADPERFLTSLPIGKYDFLYTKHPLSPDTDALMVRVSGKDWYVSKKFLMTVPSSAYNLIERNHG